VIAVLVAGFLLLGEVVPAAVCLDAELHLGDGEVEPGDVAPVAVVQLILPGDGADHRIVEAPRRRVPVPTCPH
jgi:hypothetical protein